MQDTGGYEPHLLFRLNDGYYALPAGCVGVLAECGPILPIPGAGPTVLGLTEWRGRLLTVLDLPSLLAAERPGPHDPSDLEPDSRDPQTGGVPHDCCLARLVSPLEDTALLLPGRIRIVRASSSPVGSPAAAPSATSARGPFVHDGVSFLVIDPLRLVRGPWRGRMGRP